MKEKKLNSTREPRAGVQLHFLFHPGFYLYQILPLLIKSFTYYSFLESFLMKAKLLQLIISIEIKF